MLKEDFPEIFSQINIEKTKRLYNFDDFDNLSSKSGKKICWSCPKCKNDYNAVVNHRTVRNESCPYCANKKVCYEMNDLETWCKKNNRLDILDEWDSENSKKPCEVIALSGKKYKFICSKGHHYSQFLSNKTEHDTRCPICSNKSVLYGYNDLETFCKNNPEYSEILSEWDYSLNSLTPKEVIPGSHKEFWFKCKNNHPPYKQRLYAKTGYISQGCPYCSSRKSTPELLFFYIIRDNIDDGVISGYKFNKQEIDIFSPKFNYFIEYDGKAFHEINIFNERSTDEHKNKIILDNSDTIFIRIAETDNKDKLDRFSENKNGILYFYISNNYSKNNFIRISKIFKEIFDFEVSSEYLHRKYIEIKFNKK